MPTQKSSPSHAPQAAPLDANPPLKLLDTPVDHRVVSISLGSPSRNKSVVETFLGKRFAIERIGVNGDRDLFKQWAEALDGKVDAIGVGGTNLYVGAAGRRYAFNEILQMVEGVKHTPIVDGYGLKEFLEPRIVHQLQDNGTVDFREKRCLMVMGVDRFGMSKALHECGADIHFADFAYALDLPFTLNKWQTHQFLGKLMLPFLVKIPFKILYPTGSSEDVILPKFGSFYKWAEVIAGDFLYIKRRLPPPEGRPLEGKIVLTNTVTADDVPLLRERGVKLLITTTPVLDGRSFATNVMEGVVVTLAGKRTEEMTSADYERVLSQWQVEPRVEWL